MVGGHMVCGIVKDELMAKVGKDAHDRWLAEPHARVMDFTGRPSRGMVYVAPEGVAEDDALGRWISACVEAARALPPKKPRAKK